MGTKSLLMAMAALTIAGCSQNEVTEINPDADRTIGLDVYTGCLLYTSPSPRDRG